MATLMSESAPTMVGKGKPDYILSRDSVASGRLTAQHFFLSRRAGYLLHPDIAANIKGRSKLEIADVACGNAIWSLEMAREYPQAQLTAIDISPLQLPPQSSLPKNVSFELHNIFEPIPDDCVGRFDVVHIRLIVGALHGQDKDWVIKNILRLLKPGGYLQWTEVSAPYVSSSSSSDGPSPHEFREPPAMAAACARLFAPTSWLSRLDEELGRFGVVDAKTLPIPFAPWLAKQESDNIIWTMTDIMDSLTARGMTETGNDIREAMDETVDEMRKGRMLYIAFHTTTGQKPV